MGVLVNSPELQIKQMQEHPLHNKHTEQHQHHLEQLGHLYLQTSRASIRPEEPILCV